MISEVRLTDDPQFTWNIVISNVGAGEAKASKTGLTQPPGSSEILLDTPAIAVGQSVTVTAECLYGSVAQATIRADATDAVKEVVEVNNTFDTGLVGTGGRCRRD